MSLVSVIMPCYNHAQFVSESVRAVLKQDYHDLELIVVDDKSTDGSAEVVRKIAQGDGRVRLIIHERNHGVSRSRNDGLRASRGTHLGFCDADDIWKPDKLKVQMQALQDISEYDVTYCDSEIIDRTGRPMGKLFSDLFPPPMAPSGDLFEQLCQTNFINMQTVLLKRRCVEESGYFDEGIKWVEDWWQWIRLSRQYRFLYDPRALAQYRVHSNSTGLTQRRGYRVNRWKVGKRILRSYSDLPSRVQAAVVYNMGNDLCRIRKPRTGRRFLRQAVILALHAGGSLKATARMAARLAFEPCRRS